MLDRGVPDLERQLRHLAGDAAFKVDNDGHDRLSVLEDLIWRVTEVADQVAGMPDGMRDGYTPAYPLTDWDVLEAGYWV